MSFRIAYQIRNIITAIQEFAGDCNFFTVLYFVSYNIANACKTDEYTSSVGIAQTSFYIIFFVKTSVDWVVAFSKYGQASDKKAFCIHSGISCYFA